jgi:hypothetical protein
MKFHMRGYTYWKLPTIKIKIRDKRLHPLGENVLQKL